MKTRTSLMLLRKVAALLRYEARVLCALAVLGLVAVQPARAATVYWDINGATAGAGSAFPAGTWNATNTFWNSVAGGTGATAVWASGDTAVFAAGTDGWGNYTVTVSGTQDIGGLTFEEGEVSLSGGTALRLVSNAIVDVASDKRARVSTVISEDAAGRTLTKTGAGMLVLSGVNTYTGATMISAGTLSVGADANLGNANSLVFDGGTLQVTGTTLTSYASGLIGTHAVTLNAGKTVGLDINNASNTFTVSQVLNQTTGGLTKAGPGTLILSGANTYTGNTAVNQGFLQLSPSGTNTMLVQTISHSVGAAANFNPGSGVIQTTTGNSNGIIGGWATYGSNDWAVGSADGTTLTTVTAATTYTNTSTALDDPANYTNNMNVDSNQTPTDVITPNSLRFNTAAAYTLTLQGSNTITSGGILVGTTVGNNLSKITGGTLTNGTELIVTQNNASNSLEIGSAITGGGAVTKWGPGTLTLSGTNSYTGGTRINGGTLSTGSLPTSSSDTTGIVAFNNGGILEFTGASGTVYLQTAPGASNSSFAINVTNAGGNLSVARGQYIPGMSYNPIVKGGAGTLTLANADWQDGGDLRVDEGTVVLNGSTRIDSWYANVGNITDVKPGATVKLGNTSGGQVYYDYSFVMSGGTFDVNGQSPATDRDHSVPAIEGSGTITNNAAATTGRAVFKINGLKTFSGNIVDGAGAAKVAVTLTSGGGTWTLSGNNTYSGATTVTSGTLAAGSTTAFSPNSVFTIGTTLDLAGNSNQIAGLTGGGTVRSSVGTAILTVNNDAATSNADFTFGGVLQDGGVGMVLGLTKAGSKTLTLTGANTYTGDTTVSAGTLSVTTAFFDDLSTVYISSGALLDLNHALTDTIQYLYLGGAMQPKGVYDASTPSAVGYLSGTGRLDVTTPEPATMALLGLGLAGMAAGRWRRGNR